MLYEVILSYYIDPDGNMPESLQEWKNFGIGSLGAVGAIGEAAAGTVGVAFGAVDLLAGTKVVGALSMAGGLYLIHDSKYTFKSATNKISDAWNNETGKSDVKVPEGPLQSTAQDLGCSSDCQKIAGTIDKGIEMIAGKNASNATSGMQIIEGMNSAGDAASRIEKLEKFGDDK